MKRNYIIVIDYILKTDSTSNSIDLYHFCGTEVDVEDTVRKLAFRFFYIDEAGNGVFENIPYLEVLDSNVNGAVYSIMISHESFKAVIYAIEECNIPTIPDFDEENFKNFVEKLSSKQGM